MKIVLPHKVEKFLDKQEKGDFKGVEKLKFFLEILEGALEPTKLPNAKKMRGYSKQYENLWRWRVGQYRIVRDVKEKEL